MRQSARSLCACLREVNMDPAELQKSVDEVVRRYKSIGVTKAGLAHGFGITPNLFYRILSGDRPAAPAFVWMIKALVDGSFAPVLTGVKQSHSGPPKREFCFESIDRASLAQTEGSHGED